MTHVNAYTGISYAEDPTIIGYETGNELGGLMFGDKNVLNEWTCEICQLIKKLGLYPTRFGFRIQTNNDTQDLKNCASMAHMESTPLISQSPKSIFSATISTHLIIPNSPTASTKLRAPIEFTLLGRLIGGV